MSRRRETGLEGINLLELTPVRVAGWQEVDGRVVLLRPRPRRGLAARLGYWLAPRRVRLDHLGSLSWKRLDGRTTVREVATALRQELGAKAEPAEERLGRFVRDLREEGFLAYPGWDDPLPEP